LLRGEGWAFLELTGPAYRHFRTHAAAFRTFMMRAERAIQEEASDDVTQLAGPDADEGGATDRCDAGQIAAP
jgi:hypothetical protein